MVWIDTIVQGKLIKEARKDSKYGVIDLKYFDLACICCGGIIPSCIGLTLDVKTNTRYYEFNVAALNGLFLFILAVKMNDQVVNNRYWTQLNKESIAGQSLF
jgi:hypothetical protein